MNRFRKIEIIEPSSPPSLFLRETSIFTPKTLILPHCFPDLDFTLDLLNPTPPQPLFDFTSPFDHFHTLTDLIQIETTPFYTTSTRRVQHRLHRDSYLQSLSDRVSSLEQSFDRLFTAKPKPQGGGDRKYTWTAELKGAEKCDPDRKYKLIAEIKGGKKKKKEEKNYKWKAEIKDKNDDSPITRTYTFTSSTGGDCSESDKKEKKKDKKEKKRDKKVAPTRVVEIEEEPSNHGVVVLRQAFAKRDKCKGKKELSPQDAAMMIQMSFREYLIRRSQALRALRSLAVAKAKLKEIRAMFNNFAYRRHLARDAEERQRFSEKIIVVLLTVDAIEGADLMVRSAKRSMVDELEAMLDVVDPQPPGKSLSRRTFDMPDGLIEKEIAAGVAEVVQMLGRENVTFEACR
ncbi:hypothetical protein ACSBR1_008206 [Camellia fascicularis]